MQYLQITDDKATSTCDTCCCDEIYLSPGTTDQLVFDYAPWVVGLRGELVAGFEIEWEVKERVCPNVGVTNSTTRVNAAPGVTTLIDVGINAGPPDLDKKYHLARFSRPMNGTLVQTQEHSPHFHYTPYDRSFVGFDYVEVVTKGSDGSSVTSIVEIKVGNAPDSCRDANLALNIPCLQIQQAIFDRHQHTVRVPVIVPSGITECDILRLYVKQTAIDCHKNCYTTINCYDVRLKC